MAEINNLEEMIKFLLDKGLLRLDPSCFVQEEYWPGTPSEICSEEVPPEVMFFYHKDKKLFQTENHNLYKILEQLVSNTEKYQECLDEEEDGEEELPFK